MRKLIQALGPSLGFVFFASALGACGSSSAANRGDRLPTANTYDPDMTVKIVELGDGDEDWSNRGSIIGVECKVGPRGLRNEWSDGYYEGDFVNCSNGMSYDLEYVKVEVITTSSNSH